jgi:transcription initiation factor TFIIIB Brf1 subunit/transcription initiation factor TFIIB
MDAKAEAIYEEFRCELGIHERDIIDAQNLHKDLLNKNPFRYESPYLVSAVCVYAISHMIPQKITLEEIEKISHIKKEDIVKCYKMILDSGLSEFLQQSDDDIPQ